MTSRRYLKHLLDLGENQLCKFTQDQFSFKDMGLEKNLIEE